MPPIRIVNVADLSPGDAFVDLEAVDGRPLEWIGHSGIAQSWLERRVRKPRLSRYRAAWGAARDARGADALISHMPRMTAAVEHFARRSGKRTPHLAFSFNFTDLPSAADRSRIARAIARVEQFCVYSHYEATLYPEVFGLPAERVRHVMWGQPAPDADPSAPVPDRPFVVAIGGEGRDYAGMVAAARATPQVDWMVIARPSALFAEVPANMTVRFNLPTPLTWGIAERAAAVVVPLVTDTTCCGHITLASAQLLGVPVVTTRSAATSEYTDGLAATVAVPPREPEALALAVNAAVDEAEPRRALALADRLIAMDRYDRARWADYIADFLRGIL